VALKKAKSATADLGGANPVSRLKLHPQFWIPDRRFRGVRNDDGMLNVLSKLMVNGLLGLAR